MFTYTTGITTLSQLVKVSSSDATNIALLTTLWNDSRRTFAGIAGGKWPWLEIEEEVETIAGQDYVQVPNNIEKVMSIRQQNGDQPTDVIYIPRMIFDSQAWDYILAGLLGSSDVPSFAYQRGDRVYLQPIPSSSGNRVIMRGRVKLVDLNIADYTTGTMVAGTYGSTTLTGSSTSWTANMAGRYIRVASSGNNNWGDNAWYQIASVTDSGTLELVKPYQGRSFNGVPTYVMGQITFEPEQYQMAPIYRAAWLFLQANDPLHPERWQAYARLYDGGQEAGLANLPGGIVGQALSNVNESMEGPYLSPLPRAGDSIGYPPYYFPWNDASGFI